MASGPRASLPRQVLAPHRVLPASPERREGATGGAAFEQYCWAAEMQGPTDLSESAPVPRRQDNGPVR